MANIEMPDVTVEQIFQTANPTLLPPDLPTVIIGQCRQVEYRQTAGEYDPTYSVVVNYPNLKLGAVVSLSSAKVYFSNDDGIFELDSTSFTATADDITINSGVAIDVRVVENSQTGKTTGIFFEDPNVNFNKVFRALGSSASIIISGPSENQRTFDVISILTGNKALIIDHEEGTVHASAVMPSMSSISTTFVYTDIAVREFVLGDTAATISFANTYSSSATVIDGEPTINAATDIVSGDYIAIYNSISVEQTVKKITKVTTSGITLANAIGYSVVSGDMYKVFHPVRVKGASNAGDYVVALKSGGTENYYGEVFSIASMNTISLSTALKNLAGSVSATAWTGADSFRILRGAYRSTDSNTYDGYITLTEYTADILVSYEADRNDLNDDVEAITGIDDITSILGPSVPENPLGYAASLHTQVSGDLFYVIGVSADTRTAHQYALEVLEAKEVYSLVPLSQDLDVLALYKPHVENMSEPEEKMERSAIISRDIFISDDVIVGTTANMVGGTDSVGQTFVLGLVNAGTFNTTTASSVSLATVPGIGYGASVGDYLVCFNGNDQTTSMNVREITAVDSSLQSISFSPATTLTLNNSFQIISNTYHNTVATVADNTSDLTVVEAGNVINLLDANGVVDTTVVVTAVQTISTGLTYAYQKAVVENDDFGTNLKKQIFTATTAPLSKEEQAQYIRDYAASIASRRVVSVWAPRVKLSYSPVSDPSTEQTAILPGYYLAVGVAAMTSANEPSQPFTNLPMSISTQLYYTNTYFKPTFLDTIATGGNYIFVQTTADSLPYARQQLTTDTSSIEKREYSILKAVDWFAKYMRLNLRPYIGKYNITTNYLAQLKGVAQATIADTVDVRKYLKSAKIIRIVQDTLQPDTVYIDVDVTVLYPANKIRVRIYI